jgi:hypothetical protein
MKKMRNIRTGAVAAYDEELIASGRWEEVKSEPERQGGKPSKKSIRVAEVKAEGSLDVSTETNKSA